MAAAATSRSYNIPVMKPARIGADQIVVMLGKRHSGKGYALRYLLYHMRNHYASVVLFSGSEGQSKAWKEHIPECFVYDHFDRDALARILAAQKKLVSEVGKGTHSNLLIILDDLMQDAEVFTRDRSLREIFFAGRHHGIGLWVLLQYALSIPPSLRVNCDHALLFAEPMHSNVVLLHKHFGAICGTLKQFETLFRELTDNYSCMAIQLSRLKTTSVETAISYFRAENPPPYRLGCDAQWDFNRRYSMERNRGKAKGIKQIQV